MLAALSFYSHNDAHDGVWNFSLLFGGHIADNPWVACIWSKNYLHLQVSVDAALDMIAGPLCDWKKLRLNHSHSSLAAFSAW